MTDNPYLFGQTPPLHDCSSRSTDEKAACEVGGVRIAHAQIMEVGEL